MFRIAFVMIFGAFVVCNAVHLESISYDGILDNDKITLSPFTKVGKKYYFTDITKKLNWFDAAHECRRMGGNLASVETEDEMKKLSGYLTKLGYTNDYVWIGGNDLGHENDFIWTCTGEPFSYTKWAYGQPDNGFKGTEHCVHLTNLTDHYWNDISCKISMHYVCEADAPKTISVTVW